MCEGLITRNAIESALRGGDACSAELEASLQQAPPTDRTEDALGMVQPPLMCHMFQALAKQLTPEQRGELEVIRHEVLRLRAWGNAVRGAQP